MHRAGALCFLIAIFTVAHAHLCLVSPHQRGAMNITSGGDRTCFRHGAPCGGEPAGIANATYPVNSPITVHWQQNFNHYTVGNPGYMDIAWAHGPNPSDSDFHVLGAVPDYNAHWQGTQQNFSLTIVTPNVECDPCVLRARYVPQKPGESIFYQCADVRITDSPEIPFADLIESQEEQLCDQLDISHVEATESSRFYGVSFDELSGTSEFVSVNATSGSVTPLFTFPYAVHSAHDAASGVMASQPFVLDQICAFDTDNGVLYFIASEGPLGSMPTELVIVDIANASFRTQQLVYPVTPINGLAWNPRSKTFVAVSMEEVPNGKWVTHIQSIDLAGNIRTIATTPEDNLYINYQWLEIDVERQLLYILLQNEHNAFDMDSVLYTFDLNINEIVQRTALEYDQFTYSAVQADGDGNLFAMSPGLVGGNSAWNAIHIDPTTGVAKTAVTVAPGHIFLPYYGGTFFNGLDKESGILYYELRNSNSAVIVAVDLQKSHVSMSTNAQLRHVHNIVRM